MTKAQLLQCIEDMNACGAGRDDLADRLATLAGSDTVSLTALWLTCQNPNYLNFILCKTLTQRQGLDVYAQVLAQYIPAESTTGSRLQYETHRSINGGPEPFRFSIVSDNYHDDLEKHQQLAAYCDVVRAVVEAQSLWPVIVQSVAVWAAVNTEQQP